MEIFTRSFRQKKKPKLLCKYQFSIRWEEGKKMKWREKFICHVHTFNMVARVDVVCYDYYEFFPEQWKCMT